MNSLVAALPMYDWPERRFEVDAEWARIRDRLREAGVDAPELLARRNADLPPVPGGIRDQQGNLIARDPAALPPDEFDLETLWRHPGLLLAQTCWGPMIETDLQSHVRVVYQPDYSAFEGGQGPFYSSAIVMRAKRSPTPAPADGSAVLPLDLLRDTRFAFNDPHSRSGRLGLKADLDAVGEGLAIFAELVQTGAHRLSIRAVAEGRADVAAIDCRSWALAQLHEPAAKELRAVGWTKRRMGLPLISATAQPDHHEALRRVFSDVSQPSSRSSSG